MADGLITDNTTEELDVFECPHCKETIDTSADVCRFCGAKVNHEAAQKAAHLLARVDEACSDASFLRNSAVVAFMLALGVVICLARGSSRIMLVAGFENSFLALSALFALLSCAFPFWSLRWWRKYANLQSDDEDFQDARTTVRSTGFTAAAVLAVSGAILCLLIILRAAHR
ncbi:MAG TPA: hypothetical protein VMD55_10860 [Terracidiphilus sp.]|nr:hypothetical protein [Terracidiphilus sp.]